MSEAPVGLTKLCGHPDCLQANNADAEYCARCGRLLNADETVQEAGAAAEKKNPLREIVQPFIDLVHAPRALWGINVPYLIEGMVYFGMVGYLAMYFNNYVGLNDVWAARMVGVLTAGITISMFFFGTLADKWGVRTAIITAFCLMLGGRVLLSGAPSLGLEAQGMWSVVHLTAMGGILVIVVGYGMYQPAAYAAVRQFTSEKTAAMGYAMLYALMNLGGWLPTWAYLLRDDEYLGLGISGAYWVYTGFTVVALVATVLILTRGTVQQAIVRAKAEGIAPQHGATESTDGSTVDDVKTAHGDMAETAHIPLHLWISILCIVASIYFIPAPWRYYVWGVLAIATVAFLPLPRRWKRPALRWLAGHPLADSKFFFFIFCLIPVQTLFAHNWLTLPMYVERAFRESWPWISEKFEPAVNFNPILIFILVPIVTAITHKKKIYSMMILGTFVMAAPTFLLALGAKPWTLVGYLIIMTTGEAMWQPRFLQYAAEIAPKGRTGAYMGVAQFPWFLTKMIVPLYSGWFLQRYCPHEGEVHSETMWFVYALIAVSSTVLLILARGWLGKDFKAKAD